MRRVEELLVLEGAVALLRVAPPARLRPRLHKLPTALAAEPQPRHVPVAAPSLVGQQLTPGSRHRLLDGIATRADLAVQRPGEGGGVGIADRAVPADHGRHAGLEHRCRQGVGGGAGLGSAAGGEHQQPRQAGGERLGQLGGGGEARVGLVVLEQQQRLGDRGAVAGKVQDLVVRYLRQALGEL